MLQVVKKVGLGISENVTEITAGVGLGTGSLMTMPPQEPWVYIVTSLAPMFFSTVVSVVKSIWGTKEERQERKRLRLEKRAKKKFENM